MYACITVQPEESFLPYGECVVYGSKHQSEHDERLEVVLKCMKATVITLNSDS